MHQVPDWRRRGRCLVGVAFARPRDECPFFSGGAAGVPTVRVRVRARRLSAADVPPCGRAPRMRCARGVCALDRLRGLPACARAALEAGPRRTGTGRWPACGLTRDAPSTSEPQRSDPRRGFLQARAHPSRARLREFANSRTRAANWAPSGAERWLRRARAPLSRLPLPAEGPAIGRGANVAPGPAPTGASARRRPRSPRPMPQRWGDPQRRECP
jgi:hypothetical protein